MNATGRLLVLVGVFSLSLWAAWWFRNGGFEKPTAPDTAPIELAKQPVIEAGSLPGLEMLNNESMKLAAAVTPAIVSIDTEGVKAVRQLTRAGIRERLQRTSGLGSGVIVSKQGHLVTNHHVIAGKQRFWVTTHDKQRFEARKVGEDVGLDIAILQIIADGRFFQPLSFGNSDEAEVGSLVFAIGNSFGLGETFTAGRISARERSISDTQRDLIQTDAAINPGNSGGPLVNIKGEIIGINVAIFSQDKEAPGFQGIGFAIPSNDVLATLESLRDRGVPAVGYLGVQLDEMNPFFRHLTGYQGENGLLIQSVSEGSPAKRCGLKPMDVITAVNGESAVKVMQMITLVKRSKKGEVLDVRVWRDGKEIQLKATVEDYSEALQSQVTLGASRITGDEARKLSKLRLRSLSTRERAKGYQGILVLSVPKDSVYQGHLLPGDLILSINNTPVLDMKHAWSLLGLRPDERASIGLRRKGKNYRMKVPALIKR